MIYDSAGKPLISDTDLCALMPSNVRNLTDRYKHMCGREICVIIFSMQASMNSYWLERLNLLREQVRAVVGRILR